MAVRREFLCGVIATVRRVHRPSQARLRRMMTDNERIKLYCTMRDAAPMSWEIEYDTGPVFDRGTFNETYNLEAERPSKFDKEYAENRTLLGVKT
jgi:hypothetical protein